MLSYKRTDKSMTDPAQKAPLQGTITLALLLSLYQ